MSKVLITSSLLDDLADAVSAKSGENTPMTITEMTDAVDGIVVPSGSYNITSNNTYNIAQYEEVVVNVPSSSSTDFIITLSWDDDYFRVGEGAWVPDKTFSQIQTAYQAGKTIAVKLDNANIGLYACADGVGSNNQFAYSVYEDDGNNNVIYTAYIMNNNGIYIDDNYTTIYPNFETVIKSYTPTESQQTDTITFDSDYYNGLEEVNVTINAISSNYVGSNIPRLDDTDIVNQGNNFVIPTGYFPQSEQVWVNTGVAGTPIATKGAVSNHTISVIPSVTNTVGYIAGGTKTGTAVNVTASELDSGNKSITSNGSNIDVVGYATVSVAVPFVTYYTGSGTPSSSLGANGDIYLQTS